MGIKCSLENHSCSLRSGIWAKWEFSEIRGHPINIPSLRSPCRWQTHFKYNIGKKYFTFIKKIVILILWKWIMLLLFLLFGFTNLAFFLSKQWVALKRAVCMSVFSSQWPCDPGSEKNLLFRRVVTEECGNNIRVVQVIDERFDFLARHIHRWTVSSRISGDLNDRLVALRLCTVPIASFENAKASLQFFIGQRMHRSVSSSKTGMSFQSMSGESTSGTKYLRTTTTRDRHLVSGM